MNTSETEVKQGGGASQQHGGGKFFTLFVDDQEFHVDTPKMTGAQIMALAGIDPSVGLNLIEEDGTQTPVRPTDEIELRPGRRFKKAPRFKRG